MIHYNTDVIDADRQGKSPFDFSEEVTGETEKSKTGLIISDHKIGGITVTLFESDFRGK